MIPIFICDDQAEIKNHLSDIIQKYIMIEQLDMKIELATTDPTELLALRKQSNKRGIYFLDVDLQHDMYNGFTLAKELRNLDTRGFFIFVTTHDELMFETFRYRLEAMSYLIKDDVQKLRVQIHECLNEVHRLISQENQDTRSYYTVRIGDTSYQIPMDEILYFETGNKTHHLLLHTTTRILDFRGNLQQVAEELGSGFLKVHRSFLIQLSKVRHVDYPNNEVIMENDVRCLLSRKGKKLLKEQLN